PISQQRRINRHLKGDILANDLFQSSLQSTLLISRQGMGSSHIRRRLATGIGSNLAECADHLRNGEQTPVLGHDAKEISHKAANLSAVKHGGDSLELLVRRKDRALNQTPKIVTTFEQSLEPSKVVLSRRNCACFFGQFEERARIAPCHSGDH